MAIQWIPTPPTDDLAKYVAITGLWLTLGFSAILLFVVYNNYRLDERTQLVIQMASTLHFKEDVEIRIQSLEDGHPNENKLPISSGMTPKEELPFLKNIDKTLDSKLSELQADGKANNSQAVYAWLRRGYVYFWPPIALAGSLLLTFFGFMRWREKQKRADEMFALDLEIKRQQLSMLRLDSERNR